MEPILMGLVRVCPNGCWVRGKQPFMYSLMRVRKGWVTPAHRVSWLIFRGPIPRHLWVLHHCAVKACVRPEHLYLGTPSENTKDAYAMSRLVQGRRRMVRRGPEHISSWVALQSWLSAPTADWLLEAIAIGGSPWRRDQ